MKQILLLVSLLQASLVQGELGHSWKKKLSFTQASFVPPAAPTATRSTVAENQAIFAPLQHNAIPRHGLAVTSCTSLNSKKKGASAGGSTTSTKKIQVKLLKHIAGTGQAGEVVTVTPAFFQNKLRASKAAVMISDEEVAKEKEKADALEKQINDKALELQERLKDLTLVMKRKAGPGGQLFGGIHAKNIVEELRKYLNDDFVEGKGVTLKAITDAEGNNMKTDIKNIGEYRVNIALTKSVKASFVLSVTSEG